MVRKHILRLPAQTVSLVVAEFAEKVVFKLDWGGGQFDDFQQVISWLTEILRRYDADDRKLFIGDPVTGEVMTSLHGSEFGTTRATSERSC